MAAPNENSTVSSAGAGTSQPSEFPSQVTYGEISAKHPDYRPDLLEKYEDLYCGGEQFRKNIENYLDQRQLEKAKLAAPIDTSKENVGVAHDAKAAFHGMQSRWEERKRVSRYPNLVAGVLDFFVSAVFKDAPEIIGNEQYWKDLNASADGMGTPLALMLRNAGLDHLKHFRTFIAVQAPGVEGKNRTDQKDKGGYNPTLHVLCARDVDFWREDGPQLKWIRTYRKDAVYASPIGKAAKTRELWTYITETEFIEYEIVYNDTNKPNQDTVVTRKEPKPHGFPRLPVIPLKIHQGLWAMQRMEDSVLAAYNRDASLTWHLNGLAFQVLAISSDKQISQIPDVSMGALDLGPGGSAQFVGPQSGATEWLFKDLQNKKENIYEVFQSIGLNMVGTQTQNARQSAQAKSIDREPLSAMLTAYAAGLRTALIAAIQLITDFRKEISNEEPKVRGLKYCDILTLDQKVSHLVTAQKIKGYPESALREQLSDVANSLTPSASSETRTAIDNESRGANFDEPAIVGDEPATMTVGGADEEVGKIPLALQQLALTRQRFVETGDTKRAEKIGKLMDELTDRIKE